MTSLLLQGIAVLLLWVGAWGLADMFVDQIAGDNKRIRVAAYVGILVLGLIIAWIILSVTGTV